MVPQNLLVQKQLHDDFSARVQLGFDQFLHFFSMVVGWHNVLTRYCLITEVKLSQAKS